MIHSTNGAQPIAATNQTKKKKLKLKYEKQIRSTTKLEQKGIGHEI